MNSKIFVAEAISDSVDESLLLRLNPNEELKLDKQVSMFPESFLAKPKTIIELPTKAYVDSLHGNCKNRRDLSTVFLDPDNEFDNKKITNLGFYTINRDPSSDNELANKKYVDNSLGSGNFLRFNQTQENHLKVSVGNNLTNYDGIQTIDIRIIKYPNQGRYLLQQWNIKSNDRNNAGKIQNFIRSTKTNSPTGNSEAKSLPRISDNFLYVKTSGNNYGANV